MQRVDGAVMGGGSKHAQRQWKARAWRGDRDARGAEVWRCEHLAATPLENENAAASEE